MPPAILLSALRLGLENAQILNFSSFERKCFSSLSTKTVRYELELYLIIIKVNHYQFTWLQRQEI